MAAGDGDIAAAVMVGAAGFRQLSDHGGQRRIGILALSGLPAPRSKACRLITPRARTPRAVDRAEPRRAPDEPRAKLGQARLDLDTRARPCARFRRAGRSARGT